MIMSIIESIYFGMWDFDLFVAKIMRKSALVSFNILEFSWRWRSYHKTFGKKMMRDFQMVENLGWIGKKGKSRSFPDSYDLMDLFQI